MPRILETNISQIIRLVRCLRSKIISTYTKWIKGGEIKRHGIGRPHVIKEKDRRRLFRLAKQNRRQTVAQLTEYYNAEPNRNASDHSV